MTQWYCHIGGQRYGPIGQEVLGQWVRENRLKAGDSVWCEGMDGWQTAGQALPGLFAAGPGAAPGTTPPPPPQPGFPAKAPMMSVPPPGGTGGQTPNGQINDQARQALSGRWGHAIGFSLLLWLLLVGINAFTGMSLVVAGVFELGATVFYLTFLRGGCTRLGMMFSGWDDFGRATCVYLLRALLVNVWLIPGFIGLFVMYVMILVSASQHRQPHMEAMMPVMCVSWVLMMAGIVPAIIFQMRYAQVMFLIADEPGLGTMAALRKSATMMNGFKGKLFCLHLRYFGWSLLCILTCYIGFIWLVPYMSCGFAKFYEDLRPPAAPAASAQMSPTQAE